MVKFKSGILFLVLSLFPLFLLLIFLSCFLVGYLTLFNILSSCSYAIFEDTFVYILCFLRSWICIISLYMRLIIDMSYLYKCDSSLCLAQILIFTNLYHLVISPVHRVWLLSDCFSSLLVRVFKFYKVDSDVSGWTFLYYSCLRLTFFSLCCELFSPGWYKQT